MCRRNARTGHYAIDSIDTKAINTPSKMFYETLNCGPTVHFALQTTRERVCIFLRIDCVVFELSNKCDESIGLSG